MADNLAVTPGAGATIALDDIGGVHVQRVKLIHGDDGVNDGDVSGANGLPVNVVAGGIMATDDAAFTAGTGKGTPIMGFATSDAVDAGDVGAVAMTVNRELKIDIAAQSIGAIGVQETAGGVVCSGCSTTTPLGIGGVFTGTGDDALNYSSATIVTFSDVASATDGLSIQQSTDNTNWDQTDDYTISANTGKTFGVQITARYIRIVYTNGGTAQSIFRMQVILHKFSPRQTSQRPQDARGNENDLEETLGYGMVFNGTSWDRKRGNTVAQFAQGPDAADAPITGRPMLDGGLASATAPSDVSADGDAVRAWYLRNGSQVSTLSAAGALIGGDAANGLDVDVTRSVLPTGAATSALQTQPGVDIGDVTINNASGGSAVNVQDGGNSLTFDNAVLSVVGGGAESTAQRVTIASDSTGVLSVDDNGASLTVDNATISVVGGGAEATAQRVTIANDSTGVLSVDDNGGSLTVDGTVTGNLAPTTSGGLTIGPASGAKMISAASTNATSVKGSAGQVYGWFISNINASPRYMKLYNKATAPTVGTDVPVMTILIPGNTAGAGAVVEFSMGIPFATGIGLALTIGVADADTGAVAASEIVINLLFK